MGGGRTALNPITCAESDGAGLGQATPDETAMNARWTRIVAYGIKQLTHTQGY